MSDRSPAAPDGGAVAQSGFVMLCLFWGSTWIALKLGVLTLPPVFFAGLRFVLAGGALALWVLATRGRWPLRAGTMLRLLPAGVLMIAVNYGLMAWGVQRVPSGLSAVLNLATIPIAMLVCAVAAGQERPGARAVGALVLGVAGLAVMFGPRIGAGATLTSSVSGMAAIVVGAACYAWGSVLSKPHAANLPVAGLSAWQMVAGGTILIAVSLVGEGGGAGRWQALLRVEAWGSLAYLVVVGSLLGFTVYLWLLRLWPASRVANYAFVAPVVAVLLGWLIFGERISPLETLAAAMLLAAAYLSMRPRGP